MNHQRKKISRLHYITHPSEQIPIANQVEAIASIDGSWIQYRNKNLTNTLFKEEAKRIMAIARKYNATFIVNDRVAIATEIGADGVHIGKEDLSPEEARLMLGDDKIIGCTANSFDDLEALSAQPIDYIGLGPFRFTSTKQKLSPILGMKGYEHIMKQSNDREIDIPILAIGGILTDDIKSLITIGFYGVALSGAIHQSIQPGNTYYNLLKNIEGYCKAFAEE